jgi:hypothetical protein
MAADSSRLFDSLLALSDGDLGPLSQFLQDAKSGKNTKQTISFKLSTNVSSKLANTKAPSMVSDRATGLEQQANSMVNSAISSVSDTINSVENSIVGIIPDAVVRLLVLFDAYQKREQDPQKFMDELSQVAQTILHLPPPIAAVVVQFCTKQGDLVCLFLALGLFVCCSPLASFWFLFSSIVPFQVSRLADIISVQGKGFLKVLLGILRQDYVALRDALLNEEFRKDCQELLGLSRPESVTALVTMAFSLTRNRPIDFDLAQALSQYETQKAVARPCFDLLSLSEDMSANQADMAAVRESLGRILKEGDEQHLIIALCDLKQQRARERIGICRILADILEQARASNIYVSRSYVLSQPMAAETLSLLEVCSCSLFLSLFLAIDVAFRFAFFVFSERYQPCSPG